MWGVVAVLAMTLVGCPTGGPQLAVTPTTFSFTPQHYYDSFTVRNAGTGAMSWSIDDATLPDWLTVTPMSGEATQYTQTVLMEVDTASLPSATNQATITVTSNGGTRTISVSASTTGSGPAPELQVTPEVLDFGGSRTNATLTIANPGDADLAWELEDDTLPAWIAGLTATSGSIAAGQSRTVDITLDRSAMTLGSYTHVLTILSNAGTADVAVQAVAQSLVVSPLEVDVTTGTPTGSSTVQNRGDAAINWSIDTSQAPSWLASVVPQSGNLAPGATQSILITADPDGLNTGAYEILLPVTSDDGEEVIAVTLTVAALDVAPLAVDFGTETTAQNLTLQNMGNAAFNWTLSIPGGLDWLSASPTSGRIEAQGTQQVVLTMDRASLLPGSYEGVLTVLSESGSATIPVQAEVPLGEPTLAHSPEVLNFGSFLSNQQLALWNSGSGTVAWTIDTNVLPAWLSISPVGQGGIAGADLSGSATSLLTVSVNRDLVDVATASHTLVISATGDGVPLPDIEIPVSLTVPPIPTLEVLVNAVPATEIKIPYPEATGEFVVQNVGNGLLEWAVETPDAPEWLESITASNRPLANGESATVTIKVNREALISTDSFDLIIATNDPANPAYKLTLEVHVNQVELIVASPAKVEMTRDDNSAVLSVANGGSTGTTLTFEVEVREEDRRWLFVSPLRGTSYRYPPPTPLQWVDLSISIDRANIDTSESTGFGVGVITITAIPAGDYEVAPVEVKVTVDPSPLTFESAIGRVRMPSLARNVLLMRDLRFRAIPLDLSLNQLDLDLSGGVTFDEIDTFWPAFPTAQFQELAGADDIVSAEDVPEGSPDPFAQLFLDRFQDAFSIFENDQPLEATETEQFLSSGARLKTNLAIMLDYTGSMVESAQLAQARHQDLVTLGLADADQAFLDAADPLQYVYEKCVEQLINELPSYFRVSLMEFHDRGQADNVVVPFVRATEAGKADLIAALRDLPNRIEDHGASEVLTMADLGAYYVIREDTRLYRQPFDDADIRGLVFFSDGRVTTPPGELKDTIDYLVGTKVRFFPVSWGVNANHEPLARLALASGGHYYPTFEESYLAGEETLRAPNLDQLFDVCNTATSDAPDAPGPLQESFRCDQSISRDLASHVVLSYVTLREDDDVNVAVRGAFDDPNDNAGDCLPNQGFISGTFTQALDFKDVASDVRRGQISLHSDGTRNSAATVYVRADYVPRNVNKFAFTLSATLDATGLPLPFVLERVPAGEGGVISDWQAIPELDLAPVNAAVHRFDSPDGEHLRYGDFGDMLQMRFDNVPGDFTVHMGIDNTIYSGDIEPKHFMYPDGLPVLADRTAASAFPTPSIRVPGSDEEITQLSFADDEDVRTIEIRNTGGNYPYPALNIFSDALLVWEFPDIQDLVVSPLSGSENTTSDFTAVTIRPDRTLSPGYKTKYLTLDYNTGDLGLAGEIPILITWHVAEPVLLVTPTTLDFGAAEVIQRFQVVNDGQSALAFEVDPTTPLPTWITSISPSSGIALYGAPVTITIEASRAALVAPTSFSLVINGYVESTRAPLGSQTIEITIAP
jgi:hypothetical protein